MDKIDRFIGQEPPFDSINIMVLTDLMKKVNELVEGYNELSTIMVKAREKKAGEQGAGEKR